jgi:hypothetical protein
MRCLIAENTTTDGGGIAIDTYSNTFRITNSIIHHNSATGSGGGILIDDPAYLIEIINCTLNANSSAPNNGPEVKLSNSGQAAEVRITNTIVWGSDSSPIDNSQDSPLLLCLLPIPTFKGSGEL